MTEKELEKEIKKIYGKAYVELANKTEAYFKASERLDKKMKQELSEDEYNKWKTNRYLVGKRWEDYSDEIANDMLNADNLAREAIRGNLAVTMAEGMNRAMWEASKIGTLEAGFTLYNKNAVMRLIKDKPEILPALKPDSPTERAIREGRIIRWNKQHLRAEVTQGILQGESTSKIAKRMQNVVGMEQRASMRNARTAMTSAYNGGKEAGYKEAEDMGIELEQMWVAIFDERTRHEHRQLDGQIRKVGEPFEVESNGITYIMNFPSDPNGEPEMVYNCRCTLVAVTAGMKAVNPDYYRRDKTLEVEEQEYQEWKERISKKKEK